MSHQVSAVFPTEHERSEWSRAARSLYGRGANAKGHALSVAATKFSLRVADFDRVASIYRAWLVFDDPK